VGSSITLNFGTDGRVSGNAGCNNYTGGYEASGDTLKVGGLATTFKLCHKPDGVMVQEARYLKALSSAATYEISGDVLTTRDGSGAMQVIARMRASSSLAGTSWNVVNYNNGKEAVITLIADTKITLNFGSDAQVSGNSGCNQYSGGYESTDRTVKVGPLISTRIFCETPAGVMDQEAQYLTALQNSATYEISGSTLTIRDAAGAMQVVANR
jgi:heat shock protein HslJ